jgi:hypothetical protein
VKIPAEEKEGCKWIAGFRGLLRNFQVCAIKTMTGTSSGPGNDRKNQMITDLQATVTFLVQQIQALTLENEQLRASTARLVSNVTELPRQ